MTHWESRYASRATRMQASEIRELLKLLNRPDIISFAGGIPDPKLFPTERIAKACQHILTDPARAPHALQYAPSEGYPPLLAEIAQHMGTLGVECTPENILITNGSQQALDFVGKLFISPGDTVLVSAPTYLGALQAFNAYEPTYDILPDAHNKRTIASYTANGKPRPKFGYVMPEFQNPGGTTMSLEERLALLNAADALDLPLLEDAAYEHLRYDGEAVPSLLALASKRAGGIDNAKIMYCGSFSKSIVPALRIGWVVAPKELIKKMVLILQASNLHVSPFSQMIMQEVFSDIFTEHTREICKLYKERRDAMLKALDAYMPSTITWTRPEGGMFVWMTLPESMNAAALLERSIKEIGVAFVPGSAFFADRSGHNTLRLNFSLNDPEIIDTGIKRLASLFKTA